MSKLLIWICLLGVAGLVMVGGCTPSKEDTWSENLDFSAMDPRTNTVSGHYVIFLSDEVDERFESLTLFQTGGTVQGYDNVRRSWRGTAYGVLPPGADQTYSEATGFEIQTNDGPEGQVVMVGTVYIYVDPLGNAYRCIHGEIYSGDRSGTFDSLGPAVPLTI